MPDLHSAGGPSDYEGQQRGGRIVNHEELSAVVALHGKWLRGEDGGKRANLRRANLSGANLGDVLWEAYLSEVVPALLTAGGRTLEQVATPETWACHSWKADGVACPIATAFGVEALHQVPALYRQQAERFIWFFDQGLIPLPVNRGEE